MVRNNENKGFKDHLLGRLKQEVRYDLRKKTDFREVKVEIGGLSKAEGSCKVTIGKTVVFAGTKMGIEKPYSDRPGEGSLAVNAELLPLSSPDFETGPPSIESIELARVTDRAIREGQAVDFKKLLIKKGEKVWMVFVDVVSINDDGNLIDAASIAALGALLDTNFPSVDKDGIVDFKHPSKEKLKVEAMPFIVTVNKIGDQLFVDALKAEEKFIEARLSVGVLEDGTVCALQKGGDFSFKLEEIDKALELAIAKSKELRKHFKGGQSGKKK
jgi:exosome complex component RRP42